MRQPKPGVALACVAALVVCGADAAPYTPSSDTEIVEYLPWQGGDADRMTRALRTLLAKDPKNLDIALRLAQLDVEYARREADPRRLGQAEAALAPWWNETDPVIPVLLLRATIRQSGHLFDAARKDLEAATARDPGNAQAWITLATVQQVTGDFPGAAQSCERLLSVSANAVGVLCNAALDGVTGRSAEAYAAVDALLARPGALGDSARITSWATTLAGELAERIDRPTDAERWYRRSLAVDDKDAYAIAAYADFLLDSGRPADVVGLIAADTPADVLLLRRAQADRALHAIDAARSASDLADRFAALRARGDRVHLREEARFTLVILERPDAALALAMQNWTVQKEPLDVRIALECALAARDQQAASQVLAWIDRTHLQGTRLSELVRQVRAL